MVKLRLIIKSRDDDEVKTFCSQYCYVITFGEWNEVEIYFIVTAGHSGAPLGIITFPGSFVAIGFLGNGLSNDAKAAAINDF